MVAHCDGAPCRACMHSSMPSMMSTCGTADLQVLAVHACPQGVARLPKPAQQTLSSQPLHINPAVMLAVAMQSCSMDHIGTSTAYDVNGRAYYVQVCQQLSKATSELEQSKTDCCIRLAQSCMRWAWQYLLWAWFASKEQCRFHHNFCQGFTADMSTCLWCCRTLGAQTATAVLADQSCSARCHCFFLGLV
jgi:hypothetical protein